MQTHLTILHRKLITLGITPVAWQALSATTVQVTRRKGRSLPYLCGDFFFVAEGLLKQEYLFNGAPVIERFLDKGTPCFITWPGQQQDFEALEDSVLLKIPADDLRQLTQADPLLATLFALLFAEWMNLLEIRIALLHGLKKDRAAAFRAAFPGMASRIAKKDLAQFIHVSPGYLSGNL
ncbi:hypothetical protein GCM10007415_10380 [Parapedobacter pyrenivorans]|uniref:cAMP-binding domain of CRP or a regulatory subunit of cAMP-dependent protein kinases n=1 Tax=Parapedobacter pyrenivorans TaxID=1305674 RepID=A0A917M693_9SPHI|nr:hypothetical protein [Parapedobacter pyrenivorans]GGG79978.1 hypothetical protein GCM10007415_10380 [Parapedobacter pyrenivorans]